MGGSKANEKGFTLLELAIGVALAGLVIVSAFNILLSQEEIYSIQDQLVEMEQNLKAGLDLLVREIRMAGFGQPAWTVINNDSRIDYTIQVIDGGGSNPDTLNIVGCFDKPRGTLDSAATVGSTTITLQNTTEARKFNTTTKRDIFVGDLENAKITAISGAVLTIDTDPDVDGNQGLANSYSTSTRDNPVNVYLIKRITYAVDTTDHELTRNENTGAGNQPVASKIIDFQVTYDKPLITITLTARSESEDPVYVDPTFGDGYRRRSLTTRVMVRNIP